MEIGWEPNKPVRCLCCGAVIVTDEEFSGFCPFCGMTDFVVEEIDIE